MENRCRENVQVHQWQDALIYCNQLFNYCPDSSKFAALKIQVMTGLNKLAEAIEFASKVQNQFIEAADYLYWRGKLYFLNGNLDLGKKFIRESLNKDPDNVTF